MAHGERAREPNPQSVAGRQHVGCDGGKDVPGWTSGVGEPGGRLESHTDWRPVVPRRRLQVSTFGSEPSQRLTGLPTAITVGLEGRGVVEPRLRPPKVGRPPLPVRVVVRPLALPSRLEQCVVPRLGPPRRLVGRVEELMKFALSWVLVWRLERRAREKAPGSGQPPQGLRLPV